jgi:nucleoside phosphorylase
MKKLGLVVAMDVEAMQLIEKLNLKKFDESNNIYVSNGYFGKYSSIILIITGIGMENSAIATQTLLLNYDVYYIKLWICRVKCAQSRDNSFSK